MSLNVSIDSNRGLVIACTECERMEVITIEEIKRLFGETVLGNAVLIMMGHVKDVHGEGNE